MLQGKNFQQIEAGGEVSGEQGNFVSKFYFYVSAVREGLSWKIKFSRNSFSGGVGGREVGEGEGRGSGFLIRR